MKKIWRLLPIALCVTVVAQNGSTPARAVIYITHVAVIDTKTRDEMQDRTIVISGDRILEVTDSNHVKPTAGARVVDGSGKFLVPGLWDMHVHAVRADRIKTMFPMFVANGVLRVRDMGTDMNLADVNVIRNQVANGERLGPRLVTTGQILEGRPTAPSKTFAVISTAAEGRAAVQSLKTGGADFVKVYTWLSRDAYFAIVDEAKRQSLTFVGHVPMSVTAPDASAAGQKSIEHLSGIDLVCSARENNIRNTLPNSGGEMPNETGQKVIFEASASFSENRCNDVIAILAQNHTWQVPTFIAFLQDAEFNGSRFTNDPRLKYIPASIRKQWSDYAQHHSEPTLMDKVFARHLAIVGAMKRADVPIMAGTDAAWGCPFTYAGFSLHDELALLVRAGLTPAEALQTATINPARFLGMEKDLGSVEAGKVADLLLLDADPLQDIHNTTRISAVFLSGKHFDRRALDKMLQDAEGSANSSGAVSANVH